jgi:putative (di)nucleoside polyphosphate hydrolase
MNDRPYRRNVGAMVFNKHGRVLVARRADVPSAFEGAPGGWQLPQGGIDPGEDPRRAVIRELKEEIGTDQVEILAEYPGWLQYDFPPDLQADMARRYRGQRQRWFALRFLGQDRHIRLDLDPHPEFDAWRWVLLDELPALAVDFKRSLYERLVTQFAPYATPERNRD